jgi:hypothetical protein
VRRDLQEEKEHQVESLLLNKIRSCVDVQTVRSDVPPLDLVISVTVVQDLEQDGNLINCLACTTNDLLMQLYQKYEVRGLDRQLLIRGAQIVKKLFWSTLVVKVDSKMVIDPQN